MAILYPLRPRIPRRHVIAAIAVIWIISIALSLPNLIFFTTVEQSGVTLCTYTWSLDKDLA
jgi:hypothetical protein